MMLLLAGMRPTRALLCDGVYARIAAATSAARLATNELAAREAAPLPRTAALGDGADAELVERGTDVLLCKVEDVEALEEYPLDHEMLSAATPAGVVELGATLYDAVLGV